MALSEDQKRKIQESLNSKYGADAVNNLTNQISSGNMEQANQSANQMKQATQQQAPQTTQNIPQQVEQNRQRMDTALGNNTQQNTSSNQVQNQNQSNTNTQTVNNKQFDPEEQFDSSMIGENKGVSVKEGTAQQTGMPDYMATSDARMQEITNNLNSYYATNPEYFNDRATFNSIFHYDERDQAQQTLLDTYWKKKDLGKSTTAYTNGDSIAQGMNDYSITEDQLNYIKDNNPEAYQQWQQAQQEKVDRWIVNDTKLEGVDIASTLQQIVDKLNLVGLQRYDIEGRYNEKIAEYQVIEKMNAYNDLSAKIESKVAEKEAIIRQYSNTSSWGLGGAAANNARMLKALAPVNEVLSDYYQLANVKQQSYQMALAQANNDVSILQAQAQEDQRVFNNQLKALGFAMDVNSYRTPEQQLALQLEQQYKSGQISLLQQSQQNDLNRYNQYATAKMQNQLAFELTDLNVSDPIQRKANLNNILSDYYTQYGDIIQRSQSQTLNDILKYAEDNNVSVAEALTENFIKPLQSKPQYKARVAETYGMNKYQQQYSYTIGEDGSVSIKASGYGAIPSEAFKTRDSRQEAYNDVYNYSGGNWQAYVECLSESIKDGSYGGQCGAFVNDVLVAGGDGKVFGNSLDDKIKKCNSDSPEVGYAVVFDFQKSSSDGINHGHVGIVTKVNPDGSLEVLESNGDGSETTRVHTYSASTVNRAVKGYYRPENYSDLSTYGQNIAPETGVSGYTKTGKEINAGGWIDSLESQYMSNWQNKDVMNQTLADYGLTQSQYNEQKKKYLDYQAQVSLIADTQKMYDAVKDLLEWNQKNSSGTYEEGNIRGTGDYDRTSRHEGWRDLNTYNRINGEDAGKSGVVNTVLGYDSETANGINKYNYLKNSQLLEKYQELKKAGATFGAMQKSEWDLVGSSASNLNWLSSDQEFEKNLLDMLDHYGEILKAAGINPNGGYVVDI